MGDVGLSNSKVIILSAHAPLESRKVVKDTGSMRLLPSAKRHKRELAANEIRVKTVRITTRIADYSFCNKKAGPFLTLPEETVMFK